MYWLAILALPSLFLALRPGASPSRRLLACAIGVLVPIAGPFLAVLVRRVRGGTIAPEPPPDEPVRLRQVLRGRPPGAPRMSAPRQWMPTGR